MSAPQTPTGATPGPWRVATARDYHSVAIEPVSHIPGHESEVCVIVLPDREYISDENDETLANAALIASAPDLLAECERLRAERKDMIAGLLEAGAVLKERDALAAEVTRLRDALRDCVEIADQLRAENARLRAEVSP
jgi:hypothetical protein